MTETAWPSEALARVFGAYENRPEQVEMARAVEKAAEAGEILLAEAGTGVGKTLAYLVPGIRAARAAGKPLVVATATINLQTQLVMQDLPRLSEALFAGLRVRLLKGRSNYLCHEELALARRGEEGLLPIGDRTGLLDRLADWSEASPDGSREGLDFAVPFWSEVDCETPICDGRACPSYDKCFYYAAREGLDEAEVIVTNHHYLLRALEFPGDETDAARFRNDAIPEPSLLVVDEAHALESSARSVFSLDVGTGTLAYALRRLYGERGRGLLPHLRRRLPDEARSIRLLSRLVEDFRGRLDLVRRDLESRRGEDPSSVIPARLRAQTPGPFDAPSAQAAASLGALASDAAEGLAALAEAVAREEDEASEAGAATEGERPAPSAAPATGAAPAWRRLGARLRGSLATFRASAGLLRVVSGDEPLPARPSVLWIERSQRRGGIEYSWTLAPLEVRDRLSSLWRGLPSAVLSSATLAVGGKMEPAAARLGLPEERAASIRLGSPFDYSRAARHWVVAGSGPAGRAGHGGRAGPAGGGGEEAHAKKIAPILSDAIVASRGRALVLFTSLRLLSLAAEAVRPALDEAGIRLLVQGAQGRESLLATFRAGPPAALFATDSFRQGVDLPGEQLSLLVLTRLPFSVPSEPLEAARAEAFRAEGRDYFPEIQIPDAVLRFRQGFGRLIRTASDRGIVLTLDDRILTRPYGRLFLASLPEGLRTETLAPGDVGRKVSEALRETPTGGSRS